MRPLSIIIILSVGMMQLSPAVAQTPEKKFQQALVKEEGEGALEEAINLFNQVVQDNEADRALRANALFHVGSCYEKLGRENAIMAYEKLISDFSDQKEFASRAKGKLAGLKEETAIPKPAGMIARQLWAPAEDTYSMTSDGRYMTYIDWRAISLNVKDLVTGDTWALTHTGTWEEPMQFPDNSIWSPDGDQILYYWFVGETTELHLINRDGSNDRLLYRAKGNLTPWPVAWSHDGNFIVGYKADENNPDEAEDKLGHIVTLNVEDASIRNIARLPGLNLHGSGKISPDDQFFAYTMEQEKGSGTYDIYVVALDGSLEGKLVEDPFNDLNPVWSADGKSLVFLSDRQGTHDLWKQEIENGKPKGAASLLRGNIGRARIFGLTGDQALYYGVQNERSDIFLAKLNQPFGIPNEAPDKISNLENSRYIKTLWSRDGSKVAYVVFKDYRDNVLGENFEFVIHDLKSGNQRTLKTDLYGSIRNYWNASDWSPDGKYLLVQGRTDKDKLQGFFLVNVQTGKRETVLAKEREPRNSAEYIGSFPTFTNDGTHFIYLTEGRIIQRNLTSGEEKIILEGEDPIIQYKLSPDGSRIAFKYWFKDKSIVYQIPTQGGAITKLFEVKDECCLMMVNWSRDGQKMIFAKGQTYNLNDLWEVTLADGTIKQQLAMTDVFPKGTVADVKFSPNGEYMVFETVLGSGSEIWSLENLFD